ncbi:transposase, partial [Sulfurisphaera ohwakuensis]
PIVLEEIRVLAKTLLETQERLKEVRRMIEEQVPDNHVLLTIPGIGKLAAGIIMGIVNDIRRFPKPESFVAYCGLDPVVERSGRVVVSRGISKRGNKYFRSLFYFLAKMNYSRSFPNLIILPSSIRITPLSIIFSPSKTFFPFTASISYERI